MESYFFIENAHCGNEFFFPICERPVDFAEPAQPEPGDLALRSDQTCLVHFTSPLFPIYGEGINTIVSYDSASLGSYYIQDGYRFLKITNPGIGYLQVDTELKKEAGKAYLLNLHHQSSLESCIPSSLITIEVNGTVVKTGYNPTGDFFFEDWMDITALLHDGSNSIRVSLDEGSHGDYWIQSLSIEVMIEE